MNEETLAGLSQYYVDLTGRTPSDEELAALGILCHMCVYEGFKWGKQHDVPWSSSLVNASVIEALRSVGIVVKDEHRR